MPQLKRVSGSIFPARRATSIGSKFIYDGEHDERRLERPLIIERILCERLAAPMLWKSPARHLTTPVEYKHLLLRAAQCRTISCADEFEIVAGLERAFRGQGDCEYA
jgi:hypothetical protein